MSIERVERTGGVVWRVRWRDSRGRNRARVLGRKRDAEAFEAEIVRRKRTGELTAMEAGRETLDAYVASAWAHAHAAHLAPRTRQNYASTYDRHISPRLGGMRLNEIDAEAIAATSCDPQGDDAPRRHPPARRRVEKDPAQFTASCPQGPPAT